VVRFLGKFRDPSDLVHLIRLSDQIWGHSDELASLIFGIAKNPLELVLDQTLGTLLRTRLLELLSLKQIRKLKPYWIEMLKDENEAFRESAVKQIFRATNAPERVRLIDEYIWSGAYFYNVVYLLDRLTYAPAAWRTKFAATPLSSSLTWN
jgi:hypothetical protein